MAVAILRYVSDYGAPPAEKEVTLVSGKYTFTSDDLPVMVCDGYSFAGWFFDGEYIEPGDELHADDGEVIELNAGWGATVMPLNDTGEAASEESDPGTEVQYLGKAGITHYHERIKGYVEDEINAHAVKYDAAQELTDEQKTQARSNIVAVSTAELTAKAAELTAEIESKVEKVDGMGLSSNDYTDAEQAKLATVEEGATATSIVIKTWTAADMV